IAEILNCSQGTVKSRLHYGRRKLRTLLSSYLK
ncbi:RNA polymerase subunit sigma-24, partial [candidate division KSB1 bacterium]